MSDVIPAETIAAQQGGMKIVWTGVVSSGPVNIVIPEGDSGLSTELNTHIQLLKDQGIIDQLAEKYFGAP
jgi:membrane-bound lytic murein transglycosylase MltF